MAKMLIGIVSSEKADKTIVVSVAARKTHPLYKKQYTHTRKFMAHDETNEAHLGDTVSIVETRPLSARKRHILDKVIERAPIRHIEAETASQSLVDSPKLPVKKPAKEKLETGDKILATTKPEDES